MAPDFEKAAAASLPRSPADHSRSNEEAPIFSESLVRSPGTDGGTLEGGRKGWRGMERDGRRW